MKRKLIFLLAAFALLMQSACSSNSSSSQSDSGSDSETNEPVVETFSAEYEMKGTTSAGLPKNDTFIFEGTTEDGIIKTLNFDIIRNKGYEDEYSKKGIMGYMMNVADAEIVATETGYSLKNLAVYGYETEFGQYMMYGSVENLTEETTFKDMTVLYYTGEELSPESSMVAYRYLAKEAGIELTEETLIKDLLAIFDLYKDGSFVEGANRVSFAGYHGGRSYGEQIDAIVDYILANNMTLEDVYEMFKTVNQQSEPIEERDTIAGATIAFVGDFQRMVYLAIHGELFEGVVGTTPVENGTRYEVVTQGFGGEIETYITVDAEGKIVEISVRDHQESEGIGAVLTEENSEFIQSLIAGQDDLAGVDVVSGASVTSKAMIKAVEFALGSAE